MISFGDVQQGKFRVEDYFTVKMGGKDEIEDLDEGSDPFVSTSAWDNGVSEWKKVNVLYPAPAITVATDGSAYTSYVQEFPFYAFYKVALLRPKRKEGFPVEALYYVAYLLQREEWRFVRARKFGKERIQNTILFGPVKDDKPDFGRMAELARASAAFPIIESFRKARQQSVSDRFSELVRRWKVSQGNVSSVSRMTATAYKEIIAWEKRQSRCCSGSCGESPIIGSRVTGNYRRESSSKGGLGKTSTNGRFLDSMGRTRGYS